MKFNLKVRKVCGVLVAIVLAASAVCADFQSSKKVVFAADATPASDYQDMVDQMIILVNEARTEAGLKPLYAVPLMNDAALVRALECVESFDHYRPDGTLFNTVLDEYQLSYYAAAENIAAGNSTVEATFNQWKNSTNHWKSIMNENYTHIGVGVCYQEGTTYGWYWEQIFIGTSDELEGQYIPEDDPVVPACTGDIDGDGCITSFDYVLLLKLMKGDIILNDAQVEAADCLCDDAVTIADAVVLRKYLLNIYDTLPRYP